MKNFELFREISRNVLLNLTEVEKIMGEKYSIIETLGDFKVRKENRRSIVILTKIQKII